MGLTIAGKRVLLKEIDPSDIDFLYNLDTLGETNFFERDEPESLERITEKYQWYINKSRDVPASGGLCFLIIPAETQTPAGRAYIHCNWEHLREWEIGYALMPAYWGNGYAFEAVLALIKYAFSSMNVHKIMALCNSENTRSVALLDRIGLKREGCLREDRRIRGRWYDSFIYSMLKSDMNPENGI